MSPLGHVVCVLASLQIREADVQPKVMSTKLVLTLRYLIGEVEKFPFQCFPGILQQIQFVK